MNTRAGFTLMEHMIAVTMLGVAAAGLAPVVMSTARHTRVAQSNQYETAALTEMVSRYGALSFGALTAGTTCTNHASGGEPMPHRRCVTITDSAGVLRRVRIIVTPAKDSPTPASSSRVPTSAPSQATTAATPSTSQPRT